MAILLTQFIRNLKNARNELEQSLEQDALLVALDAWALVKSRIINRGEKADGSRFGNYSRAVVPYYYYLGKETNRNNRKAVEDLLQQVGYWASYTDWRRVNNLPVDKINLSFTNKMFRNTFPVVTDSAPRRIVITLKSSTRNEQDKVNYLSERFGNILDLSKDEEKFVANAYLERRRKRIAKHLEGTI